MTGEPLSGMQRWRIGQLRNVDREVFVLDNNCNVARCIIIFADNPQRLDKVYISAGGKIAGRSTYRQVQIPASTVV